MRSLNELISDDPAWPRVQAALGAARTRVAVLPNERARSEQVLVALQVTTRSPMGAIALETAGLSFDGGWLRFLGGGSSAVPGDLALWNNLAGTCPLIPPPKGFLLVAHDVLGGFFALDGGGLGDGKGTVFYFAPDTLEWESLGHGYSELLAGAAGDLLATFYADSRWPGWEAEVAALKPDQGLLLYPPLWARESGPIAATQRGVVPIIELWKLHQELTNELKGAPNDSK